jgi:hypothetical protein
MFLARKIHLFLCRTLTANIPTAMSCRYTLSVGLSYSANVWLTLLAPIVTPEVEVGVYSSSSCVQDVRKRNIKINSARTRAKVKNFLFILQFVVFGYVSHEYAVRLFLLGNIYPRLPA